VDPLPDGRQFDGQRTVTKTPNFSDARTLTLKCRGKSAQDAGTSISLQWSIAKGERLAAQRYFAPIFTR